MHENIPAILDDYTARITSMTDSMRVDEKAVRLKELEKQMGAADFWNNQDAANAVIDELKTLKAQIEPLQAARETIEEAALLWEMAAEADDEESRQEVDQQIDAIAQELDQLETASLLSGKYDSRNAYLTIQSGAGGTEADDWCEMLMRMYLYFFEKQGWDVSEYSKTHGTEAGFKEVTLYVKGPMVYGYLSAEAGTHRLAPRVAVQCRGQAADLVLRRWRWCRSFPTPARSSWTKKNSSPRSLRAAPGPADRTSTRSPRPSGWSTTTTSKTR